MPTSKIASTLVNVLESPRMQVVMDRRQPVQPIIDEMMSHWSYDLFTRKPGAAYTDDGVFVGTDLDLACFLFALADRGAVINLPKYKSRRAAQVTEGEVITSKDNRHGKILSIVANKEIFSFSVRINDANVMTTDSVGNFRNFMIVDVDGEWYDGWKTIDFIPTAKENDFLNDKKLWSDNQVTFKHFVHPNRWVSFYGQHYLVTKVLQDRLTEEANHLKGVAKEMRERGIVIGGSGGEKKEWPKKTVVGEQKSIKVPTMEAAIDRPDFANDFPTNVDEMLPGFTGTTDSERLKAVEDRARLITYTLIPKLRFATRSTEFAFMQYGEDGAKTPKWIDGVDWERGFMPPKKRTAWSRMEFGPEVALRYRTFEKSERVAA